MAGRFTPGTFTNQIQAAFKEPRLLVVCDPRTDQQVKNIQVHRRQLTSSELCLYLELISSFSFNYGF